MSQYLESALNTLLSQLSNYRIILLNASGAITPVTSAAEILNYEPIQRSGGYQSVPLPAPGRENIAWDTAIARAAPPFVTADFSEASSGPGYTATHVAIWQGRGAISNRPISAIDLGTNRITCTGHGLTSGDRAFVRSEGLLPDGLSIQRYWVQVIDANTVALHTNQNLNAAVDITSMGVGSLHLQHANGELVPMPYQLPGGSVSFAPGSTSSINARIRMGATGAG